MNSLKWKKELWAASDGAQKYRSVNCYAIATGTPGNPTQVQAHFNPCVPDTTSANFWTPNGGLVIGNDDPAATTFGGKVFIRGGFTTIQFANQTTRCLTIRLWRMKTSVNGIVPGSSFSAPMGWDPSIPNPALPATSADRDTWRFYKFWGCVEVLLEVGKTFERTDKISSQRVDIDQWNNSRQRDYWCYSVQQPWDAATANPAATICYNLTFTGDRLT